MAAAVSRTLHEGGILLAEAGTGTGKTLAYLIPAILFRRRVLISTGTKNLQEQIIEKDLPLLERSLGLRFTTTCMKGRGNYLCLHRFDAMQASRDRLPADQRRLLPIIQDWSHRTETGDRAELDELPEDLPLWPQLSATTENCLGAECPRFSDCFVTRMRRRAAESDLVVVNHHLLCADAAVRQHSFGEVIPECSVAVIDEAHQLEEVATQYFGVGINNFRVDELVRDGTRASQRGHAGDGNRLADVRRAFDHLEVRARAWFLDLQRQRPGSATSGPPPGTGLFDERRRVTSDNLEVVAESGLGVIRALDEIEAAIGLLVDADEDLRGAARRAAEMRTTLRFLLLASDPAFVYFLETRGRAIHLRAMPIDVADIVRERIFERMHATVLTSATLAVNNRFDYVRQRLGIDDAAEIKLQSEFDYPTQSLIYLPRHLPDPRSQQFGVEAAEEIREILRHSQGRAFVLFTSYAGLRIAQQHLEGALPYPTFVQGDAPRSLLLREFKNTPHAVLLATSSFWQGVDVVGEALSCVIIDKLPFASPGDPIVQARIEAITTRGGDAFGEYQVPLAILSLLQGVGRLLRHRSDRGVIAILDPRLRTMGYGRRFLASLPRAPITSDRDDISSFFARH